VATLSAAVECLRPNGILVIIHPLGAEFVRKLNEEDPDSVPHHLPTILDFRKLARAQPLLVLDFIEDIDLLNIHREVQNFALYYASARKTPYRPLRSVLRLRGKVDKGYGRGGKKLGFPTANLPSRLFSNALEHVPNGVYFGWAVIEDGKSIRSDIRTGRNTWHKAVVNVGLSPTFAGEENREKVVEAHLIVGMFV
jgi:riboflavin kinase